VKVIRRKYTAKITGVVHGLEMVTNYVRNSIAGAEKQWHDTLDIIKQKEEEVQVEALINAERERLREEELNARSSMEQALDESSIIQCQSVVYI
jgi:hypothetical protein